MIHVITCVHNRYPITEKFVEQLLSQSYKEIHLILVDDGSTDGTAKMVKNKMPSATIITGNGTLYWGGGLHEAYKWVKNNLSNYEEYLMIANDDTEFDCGYISTAVDLLKEKENTLVTGVGIGNISHQRKDGAVHFDFASTGENNIHGKEDDEGNCASTRSLFMRVKDFLDIGGFHPILLPHYGSDYEWTIRANRKGKAIKSYSILNYYVHEETTGFTPTQRVTIKKVFSRKSNYNPIYRLNFIFMVTPLKYIPIAMTYQIKRYFTWLFD